MLHYKLNKKKILIIILVVSSIFYIGYTAGSQHIPFSNSLNFLYIKYFSQDSEKYEEIHPIIKETDVESLINIQNLDDVEKKRNQLINFIWKINSLPKNELPTKIIQNITDQRFSSLKNLERIDKMIINMEFGIDSYPYMFHPVEKNNRLIIYHQGHYGDFIHGKNVISYFVEKGYTVLAFSMPLLGSNNAPILNIENFGVIKIDSHNKLRFLDSEDFSAIKFFFQPILVSLNYIENNYYFETVDMIGLSGGSWTITVYSAVDERISKIFPVGGILPTYINQNSHYSKWEYESTYLPLYRIANYPEIFILSSHGENKEHIKIQNKYDSCCYYGVSYTTFEKDIQSSIKNLGKGKFVIYLDETHSRHMISDFSLELIEQNLKK